MFVYAEELMNYTANERGTNLDLFTQGGTNFITEAWAAAKFAEVRGADGVRLILDDRPDAGTAVRRPGRRLSDEPRRQGAP